MQRGSNVVGVRRYNERLVLSSIRRMNGASKADLARSTGLSPQAVLRIVEDLESEGLLVRAGKRTGGMGQPSTILRVNADGGYTIGVEIGRDQITCVLLNFDCEILAKRVDRVTFPELPHVIAEIRNFADRELDALNEAQRARFLGIGIAMPWFLGEWRKEIGISAEQAREWQKADVEETFRSGLDCPIFFENDGNAGALAELLCGVGLSLNNYLYCHLGTFIGGGLVLGGQIQTGRHGNAAALASMPVPGRGGKGQDYLLHHASLYRLKALLHDAPLRDGSPHSMAAYLDRNPHEARVWIEECANALAFAVIGANSLLDLDAIVLNGALPDAVIDRLIEVLRQRIRIDPPRDFFEPVLLRGNIGEIAPAVGAGLLPLHATFSPNLRSLLKSSDGRSLTSRLGKNMY
ncbi:transcriptional regulator [Sphingomonas oleivorans]|uniref:Transcriptional regulator n=1 Tax=Sphingomonas oleivorans TaxID=1735121 RepID=A0A2T5FVG8_9SPHN|nr:ROK family transcriptional regulator [Sphingomonas oleivorans]PTQ09438.1 transcriptional regulator [Sphingomonas oleivorans]